jgi:hypothetical protein
MVPRRPSYHNARCGPIKADPAVTPRLSTLMQNKNRLIFWIVLGVFGWGAIHALGAYLNYRYTDDAWRVARAVMVLLCVEAFLGFWLVLLFIRRLRS